MPKIEEYAWCVQETTNKGAWLAQSVDLRVMSSSPMLGIEFTYNKKLKYKILKIKGIKLKN